MSAVDTLDPWTLRQMARELDNRRDALAAECSCPLHGVLMGLLTELAADYRTQAIKAVQS